MSLVSAHQPAYLPWLGYFHKILIADKFVVMDDVQFEKNSFINRNVILQNSNKVMLTIPVATKDYKEKPIKDIKVSDLKWQSKHLKTITQSYCKSNYFSLIMPHLEEMFAINSDFLIDYTDYFLRFCVKYFNIKTEIIHASSLGICSKKLDYVIELTKKVHGGAFLFGSQGKDYADLNYVNSNNLKGLFQNYHSPRYNQLSKVFIEGLSILDLIFNEPADIIKSIILSGNKSKDEFYKEELYSE